MRSQLNRLPGDKTGSFAGSAIDRNRPLKFRLDGRLISSFAGDTVLSAVMASGVDTLGHYRGQPLGLTLRTNPVIAEAGKADDPRMALPMARTPVVDGADLVTIGVPRRNPLARLFQPGRTLGVQLDTAQGLERPWRALPGRREDGGDVVVVGGGVAGMEAALHAAKAGLRVTLIEASGQLGGQAGLFGTQDGEASPEADIGRLTAAIAANDAISVFTHSHAYALRQGIVRIHRVTTGDGLPKSEVIDLATGHIVLSTGAQERLPIFPGNRLPGVIGIGEAYALAMGYHVWPGETALVATGSNVAYRLAVLASDANIAITRILDSRPSPNSRFIAFSRAYGIVQTPGAYPELASTAKAGGVLSVQTNQAGADALLTSRLLVCGGWQPDLTLWHVAGGASHWNMANHRLEAIGKIDGITLAGSAAGYFTRNGCMESGRDAVNALLGRPRKAVSDPTIEPIHESPDAPPSIGVSSSDADQAFLETGADLLQRPMPPRKSWFSIFLRDRPGNGLTALSDVPQPLTLGTVAAGVDLGLIPSGSAGTVAQERVALVVLASETQTMSTPEAALAADEMPPYLAGRFGNEARRAVLVPDEPRQLSSGALVYRRSDPSSPLEAIGVVLRPSGEGVLALIDEEAVSTGLPVNVLDQGRAIPVKIRSETSAS
ncbi:MAG: hypothetical protein ABS75_08540 [Pelagibacterium sp. SCN 63-23]|nr:MAG: hypothetical protein ABS75_08540 [Pelagibacterium sp. SCN 63-23]